MEGRIQYLVLALVGAADNLLHKRHYVKLF